jgi:glycosyltransferase involved in cell wall biosynthesis
VPLYNEEDSLAPLYDSIRSALSRVDRKAEIIFVDDGSRDNTFAVAERLASKDPHLRVIKFRRNYGQTPAMAAGIDHSAGRIVITMDGDLQNDPTDIPNLLEKIDEGYDIVVGWRFDRQDKLISRKIPSKIANWLIGRVTGVPIKDNGCSLKAYRASVIKNVPLYSEMHRFIPAMASIAGTRIAEIKVNHHARQFGESKYGLSRIYKVLLDLLAIKTISTFATRPLRWFATLAIPFAILSIAMLSASIISLLASGSQPLPFAGSSLLFGSLSVFLLLGGGLAELVTRTGHASIKRFPLLTAVEAQAEENQRSALAKTSESRK